MKGILKKSIIILCCLNIFLLPSCLKSESLNIVLDPGHGGKDPGCVYEYDGTIIKEAELNLKIALFMKEELAKYKTQTGENINVYLTRNSSDEKPSLSERVDLGVEKNACIVVSLHNNASCDSSKKFRGAMILVTSSNFNGNYETEENISRNILEELSKIGVKVSSNDTIGGTAKNENGLLRRLSSDGSTYPNGDITDWYGIIRLGVIKKVPSILIEHAYLDNEEDYRSFLNSDSKLQELAKADVKGIAKYYELALKE